MRRAHLLKDEPEPVVTAAMGGAGMDGDPHTERGTVTPIGQIERALRVDGSEHGVRDRRKRRAQPVAGVLELDTAVRAERGPQDRVVMLERAHHARTRCPGARGALDVGEQQHNRLHDGGIYDREMRYST